MRWLVETARVTGIGIGGTWKKRAGRESVVTNQRPGQRRGRHLDSILLLIVVSSIGALGIAEVCLRTIVRIPDDTTPPVTAEQPTPPDADLQHADEYVKNRKPPDSVQYTWFRDDPPTPPNRKPVPEELRARYDDYVRRGLYGPQAGYIWNPEFVHERGCVMKSGFFANYPDSIEVFDPPSHTQFPRFRFLPETTSPSGLVTNSVGLRGPEIALHKPPRTVRIAFAGASTTVDSHNYAASYPEWAVHWLNRLAVSRKWNAHFEVLNAGREGIGSTDIAAIAKEELIPLDPDLIVYMEGANQFPAATQMAFPRLNPLTSTDPFHRVPLWARRYSAVARLIDRVLTVRVTMLDEPRKPKYRLVWPAKTSESKIDVDDPNLPLDLPTIRKDLDTIRAAAQPFGTEVAVSSFLWLAEPGLRLSAARHRYIFQQLNTVLWPLTYADIQKLSAYQNRFFHLYAESRGMDFIDLASQIPHDPDLFTDAIHMTEAGVRLKGWLAFEQLIPIVSSRIASGAWPRAARASLPPPPSLEHHSAKTECR